MLGKKIKWRYRGKWDKKGSIYKFLNTLKGGSDQFISIKEQNKSKKGLPKIKFTTGIGN